MPELPEVETVVRQLAPHVRGAQLERLRIFDDKIAMPRRHGLAACRVGDIFRLGKTVVLRFDGSVRHRFVQVHLRMTGRLLWLPRNESRAVTFGSYLRNVKGVSEKHRRAAFYFDAGSLSFVDPRRFGTIALRKTADELHMPGRDPLEPRMTADELGVLLGSSRQEVKVWLLRQDKLTGIGNIYASEILFRSRINPHAPVNTLDETQIERLRESIDFVLRAAIERGGTTVNNFQTSDGSRGSFQDFLQVYGRAGEACVSCGANILRCTQAQRSTFYCSSCQAATLSSSSTSMS